MDCPKCGSSDTRVYGHIMYSKDRVCNACTKVFRDTTIKEVKEE